MKYVILLLKNQVLIAGCLGWFLAQGLKTILYAIQNHKLDMKRIIGAGGMPSGHSATACGMATAAGLFCGWDSGVFAVAVFLAIIVMHDAMGVRHESGKHAHILNQLQEDVYHKELKPEERMLEFVGHTKAEVFAGAAIGILSGILLVFIY